MAQLVFHGVNQGQQSNTRQWCNDMSEQLSPLPSCCPWRLYQIKEPPPIANIKLATYSSLLLLLSVCHK
eukprot:15360821-Ditylum_brightwellii.AAC.1